MRFVSRHYIRYLTYFLCLNTQAKLTICKQSILGIFSKETIITRSRAKCDILFNDI